MAQLVLSGHAVPACCSRNPATHVLPQSLGHGRTKACCRALIDSLPSRPTSTPTRVAAHNRLRQQRRHRCLGMSTNVPSANPAAGFHLCKFAWWTCFKIDSWALRWPGLVCSCTSARVAPYQAGSPSPSSPSGPASHSGIRGEVSTIFSARQL